ncbi:uncharacterized protein LOC125235501 [Leguminivora glycinivorella]|uniref:uncharacterized protein LOC125235501 n=1 Tax=Leguminivora glycinivorella TaxID=1035111 RepID=UPI00200D4E2A|nr:uncharacterized protein LOC125235501 [Leguminivora glycinivorella]
MMDIDIQSRKRDAAKALEKSRQILEPREKRQMQGEVNNASVSTVYKHPDLDNNTSRKYDVADSGPFVVHVSREAAPNAGTSLQPIRVGQLFARDSVPGIKRDGIKALGRNRVAVECKSPADANNLISNQCLTRNKLIGVIPSYHVSRMGLVRGVPVDWSMDEFVSATELKEGTGKILKARRLQRKVTKDDGSPSWIPTQSVVVTFEGQTLPSKLYACYTSLNVEVYVLPTIQCRKCLRFGHIQTQCRSDARCYKCAQKHPGETCNVAPEHICCLFCTGRHLATDKNCPEFGRQKSIKLLMSEHNISYQEAAARTPAVRKTFAEIANTMFSTPPPASPRRPSTTEPPCTSTSYRKTIYRPVRPRTPLSPGYDRRALQNITSTPQSQMPNGHALNHHPYNDDVPPTDNFIQSGVAFLEGMITRLRDLVPPNVAQDMNSLKQSLSSLTFDNGYYGLIPSVE